MSSKGEREKRKALLLSQIQQQRLDLSASRRDVATGWRPPAVVATGWRPPARTIAAGIRC
ncbi:hypothetical protein LTSERUB_5150 [Salmonella enterica subsp. enterica serovar Rubislaw str. A4-653]|uniref:Uncharacterized protein n=1 Tax=Salmonella enterica subsp. enterica serovar Rubislaw str. A4-653 TaxID=913081 RepID=G5QQ17_SALRU|nr:hypothetical protein LTSERUB_5150 [Salmonella enterica subsp. enterica serovar Rubislaw str. A4-653]